MQMDLTLAEGGTLVVLSGTGAIIHILMKDVGREDLIVMVDLVQIMAVPPVVHGVEIDAQP